MGLFKTLFDNHRLRKGKKKQHQTNKKKGENIHNTF